MSQEWTTQNELADRIEASRRVAEEGTQARIGGVEIEGVALTQAPRLDESDNFQRMADRLEISEQVVEKLRARGEFHLETLLVQTLDQFVALGGLDGMMIASDEGLVVAQSSAANRADILAAVGSLFENTVKRAQSEGLIESVEEMTLRGFGGEQIVVRYFPGVEKRFFLIAYSREPRSYRRVTARALKICGDLLLHARRPRPKAARPVPTAEAENTVNVAATETAAAVPPSAETQLVEAAAPLPVAPPAADPASAPTESAPPEVRIEAPQQ
jgi:predicted regulator of Ras-like GTPase activity (Roadblock/LC7/MglB family)